MFFALIKYKNGNNWALAHRAAFKIRQWQMPTLPSSNDATVPITNKAIKDE